MLKFFLAFILALLAGAAQADIIICAPIAGFNSMSRQIFNPNTGNSYVLDNRGCAIVSGTDAQFFMLQGIMPPLGTTGGTQSPGTISTAVGVVTNLRDLDTTGIGDGSIMEVAGGAFPRDGGGGTYQFVASSTEADDGGMVLAPTLGAGRWIRINTDMGAVPLQVWGAQIAEHATPVSTRSIQAAFNWAGRNNGTLYCGGFPQTEDVNIQNPAVFYTDTVYVQGHVRMQGPNRRQCEFRKAANTVSATVMSGGTIPNGIYYTRVYHYAGATLLKVEPLAPNITTTTGNNSIQVNWTANPDADHYDVYVDQNQYVMTQKITVNGSGSSTATVTTLSGAAINVLGTGSWQNQPHGAAGYERGTGYLSGTYLNVPLTGGSGTGATANITVTHSVGEVVKVILTNGGAGYKQGDVLSANDSDLGSNGGSGFAVTVTDLVGTPAPDWVDPIFRIPVGCVTTDPPVVNPTQCTKVGIGSLNQIWFSDFQINGAARASDDIYFDDDPGSSQYNPSAYLTNMDTEGAIVHGVFIGRFRFLNYFTNNNFGSARIPLMFHGSGDNRLIGLDVTGGRGLPGSNDCGVVGNNASTTQIIGGDIFNNNCGLWFDSNSSNSAATGLYIDGHVGYGAKIEGTGNQIIGGRYSVDCLAGQDNCADIIMNVTYSHVIGTRFVFNALAFSLPDWTVYVSDFTKCPLVWSDPSFSGSAPYSVAATNSPECFTQRHPQAWPFTIQGALTSRVIPAESSTVLHLANDNGEVTRFEMDAYQRGQAVQPTMTMRLYGNTITSPSTLGNGQNMGLYQWKGWDGSGLITGSSLSCLTDQAWTGTAHGTRCQVTTLLSGTTTTQTPMWWGSMGGVSIGSSGSNMVLNSGELGLIRRKDAALAPGAAGLKLIVICGTTPGSAAIVARAGTSTTSSYILDNIGSGVDGC